MSDIVAHSVPLVILCIPTEHKSLDPFSVIQFNWITEVEFVILTWFAHHADILGVAAIMHAIAQTRAL